MTVFQVKLNRSPRSIVVGDHTITIECVRPEEMRSDEEQEFIVSAENLGDSSAGSGDALPPEGGQGADAALRPNAATLAAGTSAAASASAPSTSTIAMPTSVASVITDPSLKVVTPLAQSNAVPVLSGATHEVLTAEEVGFGGVSEEELSDLKQLLQNAADEVIELQDQQRRSLNEMQEVAVELAAAAASWLVGVAVDRGQFAIDDLIRKAIHQMEADQPVRVRLNPADHELLTKLMRDSESQQMLEQISCFDDATLARGTVRVESGRRILVSDMNTRLEDIRRLWMEKLDDSQIERRGDGAASGTLRRFPERRETA